MKTVLVIEDDRDTRAILGEILVSEGYEAIEVEAADAAMKYLGSHSAPCLVLLDLRLPRMNGVAFLQWLNKQEELKKLPVAVISSMRVEAEKEPFRDHVVAVLRKPFTLEDVLELIDSHCGVPATQAA